MRYAVEKDGITWSVRDSFEYQTKDNDAFRLVLGHLSREAAILMTEELNWRWERFRTCHPYPL